MADSILRSKITFGDSDRVEAAKQEGKINEFDLVCLDGTTKPKIGWLDRNNELRVVETGLSEKEVNSKLEEAITEANAYVDEKVEAAVETAVEEKVSESVETKVYETINTVLEGYDAEKFEVADVPEGTLVNYYDNEIRIMCPADTVWNKQTVGENGDANTYYVTLKTYFTDDEVVGYIEHLGGASDAEILTDIKTDKNGRRYQPTWLGVAKYDEATDSWTYYGANSSEQKYIGWDYQIDQYNADGIMIASDCVRINLSNEDCHFTTVPFYANAISAEFDRKIAEVTSGYEIVEF